MAVMAREVWTDERLDDLKEHMDEGFKDVKGEIRGVREEQRELRGEIGALRQEVRGEIAGLREELKGELSRRHGETKQEVGRLADNSDKLNYTLIAALLGLLATHYLG
jgi:uncharacterized coiled-coil DUF342 family protein